MAPVEDWRAYLTWSPSELLRRLSEVAQALSQLHEEYASVRGQEKQAKVDGFSRAAGESVTARLHYSDATAIVLTTEAISVDGQIRSLQEEQTLLNLILSRRPDAEPF